MADMDEAGCAWGGDVERAYILVQRMAAWGGACSGAGVGERGQQVMHREEGCGWRRRENRQGALTSHVRQAERDWRCLKGAQTLAVWCGTTRISVECPGGCMDILAREAAPRNNAHGGEIVQIQKCVM